MLVCVDLCRLGWCVEMEGVMIRRMRLKYNDRIEAVIPGYELGGDNACCAAVAG